MRTLRERLAEWTDWDVAEDHLGIVLGLWPDVEPSGDWGGHKGVIWTRDPTGDALAACLEQLVICGSLETNDTGAFRWRKGP